MFLSCIIESEESGLNQSEVQLCPTLTPSCVSVPPHHRACEVSTVRKSHWIPSIDLTQPAPPGLSDGVSLTAQIQLMNPSLIKTRVL